MKTTIVATLLLTGTMVSTWFILRRDPRSEPDPVLSLQRPATVVPSQDSRSIPEVQESSRESGNREVQEPEESESSATALWDRNFKKVPQIPFEHRLSVSGVPPPWDVVEPWMEALMLSANLGNYDEYRRSYQARILHELEGIKRAMGIRHGHPAFAEAQRIEQEIINEAEPFILDAIEASLRQRRRVWDNRLYEAYPASKDRQKLRRSSSSGYCYSEGWSLSFPLKDPDDPQQVAADEGLNSLRVRLQRSLATLVSPQEFAR